jgi:hypothetical protein
VNSNRLTYRRPREPMISDPQKDRKSRRSCTPNRQKLGGSYTPDQFKHYHYLITGYGDSGQQEEKRDIWLRVELKKACWFSRSGPSLGKPPTGFSESDVGEFIPSHAECRRSIGVPTWGKPPDLECDVGLKRQPSDGHESDYKNLRKVTDCQSETTLLTDDEIRHDISLIMNSTRF